MRLLALMLLCVVVAMHHGVPMLGHEAHGAPPPSLGGGHGQGHGDHGVPGDDGDAGLIGTCLAVIVVAGMAVAALSRRRALVLRRGGMRVAAPGVRRTVGPPPHGPPRPIRPCVMLR